MKRQELKKLYQKNKEAFVSVLKSFPDDDLAGPFLMSPNEAYYRQKSKLFIIGQETNGWSYHIDDFDKQMQNYEDFNVGSAYYASPFWNIIRKLESAIKAEPYSCAWTNISKFDLEASRPYGKYLDEISKLDIILKDEINLLKPDICHFFTGPAFDYRIELIFPGVVFENIEEWNPRQFCKLIHPDLPINSFRSYHPKSLRIRKLENRFINYFENSISHI